MGSSSWAFSATKPQPCPSPSPIVSVSPSPYPVYIPSPYPVAVVSPSPVPCSCPTSSPTPSPTTSPTPSPAPTATVTPSPTPSPTVSPTPSPSQTPTRKLAFLTGTETEIVSKCSKQILIANQDLVGNSTPVTSNLSVSLSSQAGVDFHSNSDCTSKVTQTTIPKDSSVGYFYFSSSVSGSLSVIISSSGLTGASQSYTVTGTTPQPSPSASVTPSPTPTASPTVTPTNSPTSVPQTRLAIWANDGGDKVIKDDLRLSKGKVVTNKVWDGEKIKVFGAKNEVVSFNVVLEANESISNLSVKFNELKEDTFFSPQTISTTQSDIFNYIGRNIEVFLVQYLQIKGLSRLSYETYDERHVPKHLQRPWTGAGYGSGTWNDRPNHDKYYPDIAVPIELKPTFTITAGSTQSIWVDVYIPKTANSGLYKGVFEVLESSVATKSLPVELTVKNFALPDVPSQKAMSFVGYSNINQRFVNESWPNSGTANATKIMTVRDRYFQAAHRHKIDLIDGSESPNSWSQDAPLPEWQNRLSGNLYSASSGYDGPGVSQGHTVFSVGTYGSWSWKSGVTASIMATRSGAWENWFKANYPSMDRFLYLIDESTDYTTMQNWASWTKGYLPSFATLPLDHAIDNVADLSVSASWISQAPTTWQTKYDTAKAQGKKVYFYNGKRVATGSFATEDDGVALREVAWAQYKKGIDRWFYWEVSYYNDYQSGRGQTDVFNSALTFGSDSSTDSSTGRTGWNYSNGDGLLMYPGTDKLFPSSSLGVDGPIMSLRLKHWRRGIQDADYITLAAAKDSAATKAIVDRMVPKALWEYGVTDSSDPTWVRSDISWSINPDDWEQAREDLVAIILK
jgi:hypothetical protein